MAKVDGFLNQLATKGGSALFLKPGMPPTIELPGGHRTVVSGQDMLSPVIDGIVKEILPDNLKTEYLRGDTVTFQWETREGWFEIRCTRAAASSSLLAYRIVRAQAPPPVIAPPVLEAPPVLAPPPVIHPVPPVIAHPEPVEVPTLAAGAPIPMPAPEERPAAAKALPFSWHGLLGRLLEMGGSDLYLCAGEAPLIRRHGTVETLPGFETAPPELLSNILRGLAPTRHWKAFQDLGQADFSHADAAHACRLRVNLVLDAQGPSAVLRVIPEQIPDDETLSLGSTIQDLADIPKGLVILAGTPGSGRTTTLAALLRRAAERRSAYIVSVEDTVEFKVPGGQSTIRQREAGADPEDQRRAIRAALRQAPDVLAVDSVKDSATALQVLEAANSGRLVIAVVEAPSAVAALERFSERLPQDQQHLAHMLLSTGLKAVAHQTLLKRIGGGRVAAFETLFNAPAISEQLRKGELPQAVPTTKTGRAYGQVSQADALIKLVKDEEVDLMEAYTRCHDRQSFMTACKAAKLDFDPRRDEKSGVA
ncbi:MAG TPA: ATPase, T2SS/T4P/T4SS family [Holophagaceae bacterium]|nr:ATPase, T2SS/T4P/T4SS family [Holophagaceae bacterium]